MTDRELLELAAKAAGIILKPMQINNVTKQGDDRFIGYMTDCEQWPRGWFNPLTDDGDALRLAVKLAESAPGTHFTLSISKIHDGRGFADAGFFSHINPTEQVVGPDLAAATRRAIVRAAAEIGRAME